MVLNISITIIASILLLGLTILVHEFGHYLAARLCGMKVDVFSIGFGPALWKIKRNDITYKISAIPFGGYVALPQMEPATEERGKNATERKTDNTDKTKSLPPAATWKRIVVSLSGATGNVMLAFALAWLIYGIYTPAGPEADGVFVGMVEPESQAYRKGIRPNDRIQAVNGERVSSWTAFVQVAALSENPVITVQTGTQPSRAIALETEKMAFDIRMIPGLSPGIPCRVRSVETGSPAARAGLQAGDLIVALDGRPLGGIEHMIGLLTDLAGKEVLLTVQRGQQTMEIPVVPAKHPEYRRPMIGVRFDIHQVQTPLAQLRNDAAPVFRLLRALLRRTEAGEATRGIGGPVSVLTMLWLQVSAGLLSALAFTRFLNINLAIINLLPIPVLDGGHIMFALFEIITRKRMHPRVLQGVIHVFALLLIALMLLLTFRDITKFIPGLWQGQATEQTENENSR